MAGRFSIITRGPMNELVSVQDGFATREDAESAAESRRLQIDNHMTVHIDEQHLVVPDEKRLKHI